MAIEIVSLAIDQIKLIKPTKIADSRGFFSEIYREDALENAGLRLRFVQENQSLSKDPGVIRGLHFQVPGFAQDKLVRVVRGRIFDVAVDLRRSSATYGRHVTTELSAENMHQLLVPMGFAHGFCTLEPDTVVVYKVTNYYSRECDRGVLWNDPDIGVEWPKSILDPQLSERDQTQPRLRELTTLFD